MNKLLELDATTGLAANDSNLNLDKLLLKPPFTSVYTSTLSDTTFVSNTISVSLTDDTIVGFGLN